MISRTHSRPQAGHAREFFFALVIAAAFVLVSGLVGSAVSACSGKQQGADVIDASRLDVARDTARAAVQLGVVAVQKGDEACAAIVALRKDRALGERCDAFYVGARKSLIVAATIVDTWDSATSRAEVVCRVVIITQGLADVTSELRAKGAAIDALKSAEDAISFAKNLGMCPYSAGSATPPLPAPLPAASKVGGQ
jgi:hypothetical protein